MFTLKGGRVGPLENFWRLSCVVPWMRRSAVDRGRVILQSLDSRTIATAPIQIHISAAQCHCYTLLCGVFLGVGVAAVIFVTWVFTFDGQ